MTGRVEVSRRQTVRIPQLRKSRVLCGRFMAPCVIVDLSVGGALIEAPELPHDATSVYLEIGLGIGREPLLIEAQPVRETSDGLLALRFRDGDRDGVGHFLADQQRVMLANGLRPSYERRRLRLSDRRRAG